MNCNENYNFRLEFSVQTRYEMNRDGCVRSRSLGYRQIPGGKICNARPVFAGRPATTGGANRASLASASSSPASTQAVAGDGGGRGGLAREQDGRQRLGPVKSSEQSAGCLAAEPAAAQPRRFPSRRPVYFHEAPWIGSRLIIAIRIFITHTLYIFK